MIRRSPAIPWTPLRLQWLCLGAMLILVCLPHLLRLQWLSITGWLLIVLWRLLLGLRQRKPPGRLLRLLIIILAGLSLYQQFGTFIGKDAGTALLVMMAALKFFEIRTVRDAVVLVFLGYFLIVVELLFSQSMLIALYVLAAGLLCTITLMELSDPRADRMLDQTTQLRQSQRLQRSLRLSGTLLLQAAPIMLILFVLFPRIPGPLWSLPHDAHSGLSGLGNEMEPGRISQLVLSEAIAFRVEFADEIPPPEQRYWRGPVFENTDGRRWFPAHMPLNTQQQLPPRAQPLDSGIRYTITLEPHGKRQLPALDLPLQTPVDTRLQADFQVLAKSPVLERLRYPITSHQSVRFPRDPESLRRSRYLPADTGPRLLALASEWRAQSTNGREIIAHALTHFRQQPFIYTLNPPRLGDQPMETFLFETRRGFCEHYSAAFTLLMRAAGLPARVVTGYLGGEMNPVGNYMVVRQSDAHAWAEVWLEDQGWLRVDPTSAVAPERVERAIDLRTGPQGAPIQFRVPGSEQAVDALARLRQYLDAANNRWNQWVLGYGPSLQQQFLQQLGLPDVSLGGLARVLSVIMVIAMVILAIVILYPRRPSRAAEIRIYEKFCRKLSALGYPRAAHEGPSDYARRTSEALPRHAGQIQDITRRYIGFRYGEQNSAVDLKKLSKSVQAFPQGNG